MLLNISGKNQYISGYREWFFSCFFNEETYFLDTITFSLFESSASKFPFALAENLFKK